MSVSTKGEAKRTAERLRLSKALPEGTEAPGVVVQLQRLADRANVELTSIKTNSFSDYGSIRGTEFEVRVTGRFFDVDDFLYRLHRQVAVDEKDRPIVGGRLFATTSVDLTLDQGTAGTEGSPKDDDLVVGTVKRRRLLERPRRRGRVGLHLAPTTAVAAPATSTPAHDRPTARPPRPPPRRAPEVPSDPPTPPRAVRRRRGRGPDARRLRRGRGRRRARRRATPRLPDASLPIASGAGPQSRPPGDRRSRRPGLGRRVRASAAPSPATTASATPHDAFDQQVEPTRARAPSPAPARRRPSRPTRRSTATRSWRSPATSSGGTAPGTTTPDPSRAGAEPAGPGGRLRRLRRAGRGPRGRRHPAGHPAVRRADDRDHVGHARAERRPAPGRHRHGRRWTRASRSPSTTRPPSAPTRSSSWTCARPDPPRGAGRRARPCLSGRSRGRPQRRARRGGPRRAPRRRRPATCRVLARRVNVNHRDDARQAVVAARRTMRGIARHGPPAPVTAAGQLADDRLDLLGVAGQQLDAVGAPAARDDPDGGDVAVRHDQALARGPVQHGGAQPEASTSPV